MTGTDFEQLLATLYLENAGDSTFVGTHPEKTPSRTFGGQLMAQAVVAAAHTVKHTLPSAMHMHFISGGPRGDEYSGDTNDAPQFAGPANTSSSPGPAAAPARNDDDIPF